LLLASPFTATFAQDTVKIGDIVELSGGGAPVGANWRDGITLAFDEINAAGGILGKQVEVTHYDSQTDPQTSRALVQKAIDDDAFVIMGTIYSSSTVVNMLVAQQNGVPQITGSEAPSITTMGNPYIFRTAFGAQKSMPKLVQYLKEGLGAGKVAVAWVNNEFGKGGRDSFVENAEAAGIEIVADVPSEAGQADFATDVVKLKSSGADVVFMYLHEEESARIIKEYRKQGVEIPVVGETTLISQKVIDLAGEALNGVQGHIKMTAAAPIPRVQEFAKKFEERFGYTPDHNGIKGYMGAYVIKYVTEMVGEFDRDKFADKLHGLALKAEEYPGVLMDISWDENGETSHATAMGEIVDGKLEITKVLPSSS
jgi:branched-chain amino acid transport system substrate-binding protein